MPVIFGIILLSTVVAVGVFRRSPWPALRQLWLEMGLLLLATVAMVASTFVTSASGSEKSLVMLAVYSGALMSVGGGVHMMIMFVRKSRAVK